MGTIIINFLRINGGKFFKFLTTKGSSLFITIIKGISSFITTFITTFLKPFLFSRKRKNMIIPYFWATLGNIALFITIFMDIFLIFDYAYIGRKIPEPITTFATINALIVVLIAFNQSMIAIYNKGKDDGSDFTEDDKNKPSGVV